MASFVENASELHHALAGHDHAGIIAHLADDAVLHQGIVSSHDATHTEGFTCS